MKSDLEHPILTSFEKAQEINNDFATPGVGGAAKELPPINYRGAIAEIGAGQEVARAFFEASDTSKTIVKTMSAYGMGCSDAIYGKDEAYVSRTRLEKMFNHDYKLLFTRSLSEMETPKEQEVRYFVFCNTVDINHGWAGIRVQTTGSVQALDGHRHECHEFRIHFQILEPDKRARLQINGTLGINLIHSALRRTSDDLTDDQFVGALMDNIEVSNIRIDSISVKKYEVSVHPLDYDKSEVVAREIDESESQFRSRAMSIKLVKDATVRCMVFTKPYSAGTTSGFGGTPSRELLGKNNHLVLTKSCCDSEKLFLEVEMLECATRAFARELSNDKRTIDESDILTAIHLPILSAIPSAKAAELADQRVYIFRSNEPVAHRDRRLELMETASTDEVSLRIDRILEVADLALLSEYSATSEIIKFLRTRTQLQREAYNKKQVAYVLRADQFLESLINIEERYADRNVLEIIGSIARRRTRIYIYPCFYSTIYSGNTRYGEPFKKRLTTDALKEYEHQGREKVDISGLMKSLVKTYAQFIGYMKWAEIIDDLHPTTDRFYDAAIQSQV
jgi:hypothetical protein